MSTQVKPRRPLRPRRQSSTITPLPNAEDVVEPHSTWTLRERWVLAALSLCWVTITLRLLQIQVWQQPEFTQQALRQQTTEETIPARPGDILDRNGRLLATTIKRYSLYLNPTSVEDIRHLAAQLAPALDLDTAALEHRLEANASSQFLWVKRRLSDAELDAVRVLDLQGVEWGFQPEFQRILSPGTTRGSRRRSQRH